MSTTRPIEIEPLSNRFLIHPIGEALLPLAIRLRLHPTAVTGFGLIFGLLAGWAYLNWTDWRFATAGLLLMVGWHIMDGLDGKLARATNQTSDVGRLLDGVADYTAFVAVYVALAVTSPEPKQAVAVAALSGLCHALQSLFYEGERATYIRRKSGLFQAARRSKAGGLVEEIYNRCEAVLGNRNRPIDIRLQAADPDQQARILQIWHPRAARAFRLMWPLSANGRTSAIWIAVMFKDPMLYWLWEILFLSLLSLMAARALRQAEHLSAAEEPAAADRQGALNRHA